ncbi:hypothetical protein EDB83DRAFT_2634133 [Lactarius deliciosus]|nr:hypothetical protein EDB83DRAFT_2634133 [Lactarius deliciosus]
MSWTVHMCAVLWPGVDVRMRMFKAWPRANEAFEFRRLPNPSSNHPIDYQAHLQNWYLSRLSRTGLDRSLTAFDNLHFYRCPPLESFDISRNTVAASLIRALDIRVASESEAGQDVNKMVGLCREFLSPNISADSSIAAFTLLGGAVITEIARERSVQSLDRDKVIECLRDAARLCPLAPGSVSHLVSYALALTLWTCFLGTSNGDYEEGTALLERILDPNQSGGCPDSVRDLASYLAGTFAYTRSTFSENPEDSEITISRYRTLRNSSSIDGRVRRQITGILAMQTRERFIHYSLSESLEEANSYTSQLVDLSSSRSLEESGELLLEPESVRDLTPSLLLVARPEDSLPGVNGGRDQGHTIARTAGHRGRSCLE